MTKAPRRSGGSAAFCLCVLGAEGESPFGTTNPTTNPETAAARCRRFGVRSPGNPVQVGGLACLQGARKPIWRCSHLRNRPMVEKFPGGKDAFGVLPKPRGRFHPRRSSHRRFAVRPHQ